MKNLLPRLISLTAVLAIFLTSQNVFPGEVILVPGSNQLNVVSNTDQALLLKSEFHSFSFQEIKTPEGIFTRLAVNEFSKRGVFGEPEFSVDSRLIEIPAGAEVQVNILNSVSREYSLAELGITHPLFPAQPPIPKTGQPVEFEYNELAYQSDQYFNLDPVTVESLGVMRGVRIGRLDISPLQYNPVEKTIRVYERLEFEVLFLNADIALTESLKRTYSNHYFNPVYHTLLNFKEAHSAGRDSISRYPIKYVIVSDPMFEDQLQALVEWKTRKGFEVIEAYTDDPGVGTTTYQIKNYLQSLYDNATPDDPAPTFVLFVGDIAQVPTWTGQAAGHVTDLPYVEYTNDYFPEIYYGRFSAQNTAQLQPQIDKTLMYEQYTMPDPAYLEEVVMIAGVDGTFGPIHGNGQINYGTTNYFNEAHDLLSHTYLYPESGSSSAAIRQNISDGVTFANYTAHGSPSGWADPSFTTSHIPALQNEGKYGLLIGNCCSTSEYQVSECFGEAVLRAENKGAMGYIGASNSTYWDEDYYFGVGVGTIAGNPPSYEETTLGNYDRAFHDHGEPFEDWYTTMDQMIFAGNLAVTLGSSGMAQYYWEAYCLMGDPSLMVYLGVPSEMTVTYDPLIPLGSPSFTVNAVPYAYVALSIDGTLLGAALADGQGVAVIMLEEVTVPGMAEVIATAQDYQPFTGSVLVANPEGPYVILNEFILVDSVTGNGNGIADCGETFSFDTELKNWGSSEAVDVIATLSVEEPLWVTITDDIEEFGSIPANDSVMQAGAFTIQVLDSVPDQAVVSFDLAIEDGSREIWSSNFSITLNAPVLHMGNISIVDTLDGNSNGRLDPGETVDIYLMAGNTGHCDAWAALATLASMSEFITLNVSSCEMDTLAFGNMYPMHFNLSVSAEAPIGSYVDLSFELMASPYACEKVFLLPVGLVVEDFETGDFTSFGWLTAGNQPWDITAAETFEGNYAAVSGDINDSQTSQLYLDMEVFTDDSISFYRKVSCEDDPSGTGYDWLAFYIDDVEMDRWDGELDWSRQAYPVVEGTHTFKWVFSKDYSVSSGSDAAWVDYIIFPGVTQYVNVDEKIAENRFSVKIHPNPVASQTSITFSLENAAMVDLNILDISGRHILSPLSAIKLNAGQHSYQMDLEFLPAGMYFIEMISGQGRSIHKIIKK